MLRAAVLVICVCVPSLLSAADAQKVTVLVRGVHCEACVKAVRKQLATVKGVKVDPDQVFGGEKPRWFSPPFEVTVGDTPETGLGALAKAVSAAKTPHADDLPPRLNLVLFTDKAIDEPAVMVLRAALQQVNGVLVNENGGLGGIPKEGFYWIRLEPAGGVDLKQVLDAAKTAVSFSVTKQP